MEISEILDLQFPFFEKELREVIIKNGQLKIFEEGTVIIRSGQYFKSTFLLTNGKVKLYVEGEEGEEFFMYYIEPGQACALSFICSVQNKASDIQAVAAEKTEAILIPIEIMDNLMTQYKSWYNFVLQNYRSRFLELLDLTKNVAFKSMDERLEHYLLRQKKAYNSSILHLTHEQIANDLNSSRVVISRLLKQMEQDGYLNLHRNSIEILDM